MTSTMGMLLVQGWPYVPQRVFVAGAVLGEVGAGLGQAQPLVRATPNDGRVLFVLAVVLPETDRADVVPAALRERHEPAARARVGTVLRAPNHVLDGHPGRHVGHASQGATPGPGDAH